MKVLKHIGVAAVLCTALSLNVSAQPLVSEEPQNRKVLLEEFTGIHCGYCPDGHAIARDIQAAHPGDVVLVNVHAGFYANPNAGEPDFRTQWGDPLADWSGLSGYPAGMVNRHLFSGQSARGMGRNLWTAAADEILEMSSPCNVGLKSEYDESSRTVTITALVYYTDNTFPKENYLNVVITENGVVGYQSGDIQGQQGNYTHNHIMRAMVTGQWGESITHEGPGTLIEKEYVYVLPEDWVAENCDVVAFVAQGQAEVYSAAQVHLNGGATTIIADAQIDGEANVIVQDAHVSSVSLTGYLPGTQQYRLTLSGTLPQSWSAEMSANGAVSSDELIVEIAEGEKLDIGITMVPQTPGFGEVALVCTSVDMPNAAAQSVTLSALRPATEILVSHFEASDYTEKYESALTKAGAENMVVISNEQLAKFLGDQTLITEVQNIYYNVSWSFPALSDQLTGWLKRQMDAGSNLFIAGQDIGWDLMSGHENANGTQLQAEFFTDYLHAEYLGDGDNSTMTATFTDEVLGFDEVGGVLLVDPFGGNMYPEQLATTDLSHQVFAYNANDVTGGVYAQVQDYKVVYLGIGLEQFGNPGAADMVMKITRDWFTGVISDVEYGEGMNSLFASTTFPNPTSDNLHLHIDGHVTGTYTLRVIGVDGSTVLEQELEIAEGMAEVSTSSLPAGAYSWMVIQGTTSYATGSFIKN